MNKINKWLVVAFVFMVLASSAFAAITINTTSPSENSTFCQSVGNNIDLNISGSDDGNLFRIYIDTDTNLWVNDDGNGNRHPDFNAFYANSKGYMNVELTIPPSYSNTGNRTITVKDLNGGVVTATTTLNVKPTWTSTNYTTSPLICTIADYTTITNFRLTDNRGNGLGYMEFNDSVDLSGTNNFDTALTEWTNTKLNFSLAALNSKKTTIQFTKAKLASTNPKMYRNNDNCDQCNLLEANGDLVKFVTSAGFTATHSTYEVTESTVDDGADFTRGQLGELTGNGADIILGIIAIAIFLVIAIVAIAVGKKKRKR